MWVFGGTTEVVKLSWRQQYVGSNIATVRFNRKRSRSATHASRSKLKVGHLMERREGPSGRRVIVVYDHKRSDIVGQRKTAECLDRDVRVVNSLSRKKENKDGARLKLDGSDLQTRP